VEGWVGGRERERGVRGVCMKEIEKEREMVRECVGMLCVCVNVFLVRVGRWVGGCVGVYGYV